MNSLQVHADIQEKLRGKPIYFLDDKNILVKFDSLNFAILSRTKLMSESVLLQNPF